MAPAQGHHHLRCDRRDPHAVRCRPICRSRREEIADAAIGPPRPAPPSCICTRATPKTGRPDQTPEAFARFPAAYQAAHRLRRSTSRPAAPLHDDRGAGAPGGDLQARGRLAQHGLDEFRPVPDARAASRTSSTTGSRRISRTRATSSSATPSRTSNSSSQLARQRHALRVRVLRHRPSLQPAPTSSTAASSSRRCSSRPCSASWAASARIPRTSLHMKRTADRLFGDQYRWSVLGAGRKPVADRRDGRRDGRQCPRRARGLACGPVRASSPSERRASDAARQIIEGLGLESRPRTRRARS